FAVLLREIRRQDVMRHGGGVRTVEAVLEEDHSGNRRVVARREEDEPAVVAQILAAPRGRQASGVRDHLRGARLAADVVPFDARPAARPAAVADAPHPLATGLALLRRHVDLRLRPPRLGLLPRLAVMTRLEQL